MEQVEVKSNIKFEGHVKVYSFPADKITTYEDYVNKIKNKWGKAFPSQNFSDKEKCLITEGKNLVTNNGVEYLLNLMTQAEDVGVSYMEAGTGSASPPSGGDIELETPVTPRVPMTDAYRVGFTAYWEAFFGKDDAVGIWEELGLYDLITDGVLIARKTLTIHFDHSGSANTAIVSWGITGAAT